MRVNLHRETALFSESVARLAEHNIVPTPHESARLYHLCREATGGDYYIEPMLAPIITARGVPFYPITIGALVWLDTCACVWWAARSATLVMAEAFACAHANDAHTFARLSDQHVAERAVFAWAQSIPLTPAELRQIVNVTGANNIGTEEVPNATWHPQAHAADWGRVIARICKSTNLSPHEAMWTYTRGAVMSLLAERDDGQVTDSDLYALEAVRSYVDDLMRGHGRS